MKKISVALFFGGRSPEYAVSLASAAAVLRGLDLQKYAVYPVGITRAGVWLLTAASPDGIEADRWQSGACPAHLSPDRGRPGLYIEEKGGTRRLLPDVLFPVMHGKYGEDGCMQGLFALSGIPFVGCGVRAACLGMDKIAAKQLAASAGLPVLPHLTARRTEHAEHVARRVEDTFPYPVFVKPAAGGSSIGAGIARDRAGLLSCLGAAWESDRTLLIEPFLPGAREIEVGVAKIGRRLEISTPGEIHPGGSDFYDYATKYTAKTATLTTHAPLLVHQEQAARARAALIYRLFDCHGPVRVDFFLSPAGGPLYFNEINTLPGFTAGSMFPRLMTEKRSFPALLDLLIAGARRG